MHERVGRLITAAITAGISAVLLSACAAGPPRVPDRVVLGLVPTADVDRFVLAAEGLARLLSDRLGVPVETRVVDGVDALSGAVRAGQVDVALLSPTAAARAVEPDGAEVVLQSLRDGTESVRAQWMTADPARFCATPVVEVGPDDLTYCNGTETARTGPVGEQALTNLVEGEPVLFVEEGSLAGHLYPATQIRRLTALHPITGIDTRFVRDGRDAVLAVARGDAPVGVAAVDARTDLLDDEPEIAEAVTVFARSEEIPHDVVAVRGGLPAAFRDRITGAMTAVVDTPRGAAAFDAVYGIDGLVPAAPGVLDGARQVLDDFGP